jgi:hypothetical protein
MLTLISAELILIGWFSGLRVTGFGRSPLGGNAFTTRQVGQLPAFRADVRGVPSGVLSQQIQTREGVSLRMGFSALVWWWHVVRQQAQICATV